MRTLCPNLEREDGLETVLEVPMPEESFVSNKNKLWRNIKSRFVATQQQAEKHCPVSAQSMMETQFILCVIGAPLVSFPIRSDHRTVNDNIKDLPVERSMAKYIVQQYIAASGGEHALKSIDNMYAMGKVKMSLSEFESNRDSTKLKSPGPPEIGGFVLWQKRPDMWNLELMVSGCKISAGSDGNIAWRQSLFQNPQSSRGPSRPLRRSLQGLDPLSTANLFSNSICIGEKTVVGEGCFVLKLESAPATLKSRSSNGDIDVTKHTLWGCFSQKTGLLVQFKDSHRLRMKSREKNNVFWETTMESTIGDYRAVDGVNIAHSGKSRATLLKFEEGSKSGCVRTSMEEVWSVEEVDFNVKGLSVNCFLPPSDLENEDRACKKDDEKSKSEGLKCDDVVDSSKGWRKLVALDEVNMGLHEKISFR